MKSALKFSGAVLLAAAGVLLVLAGEVLAKKTEVRPGWWRISVEYPRFGSHGSVSSRANAACRATEHAEFNAFRREAQQAIPTLRQRGSKAEFELKVIPTVSLDSNTLCSGYVERYAFTGGAHGTTTFTAITYGSVRGQVRPVQLADLFVKGEDAVGQASQAIIQELRKRPSPPSAIASGKWQRLTPAQARRFTVYKLGLVFLFDRGELGPQSEGAVKVLVPFDSLPGLDRSGILKPVLARAEVLSRASLTGGRWHLQSIIYNDDTVLRSQDLNENWIEFRDGRVAGKAGANRFTGTYTEGPDRTLKIGPLAMTRALNPPGSIAAEFEKRVGEIHSYLFRDGNLILELPYDSGVMRFTR